MQAERRETVREATGMWWLFLVTGILWMLIALVVLRFNVTSIEAVGFLVGVILLIAGINEFLIVGVVQGWKWLHVLLGILFVVGGIYAMVNPIGAFYEIAAVLGLLLVLKGSFDIMAAALSRESNPVWGLGLAVGILEVLLGFWASQQFFQPRAALILIWVGFTALFRGLSEIVLAFQIHKVGKEMTP